MAGNKTPKHPVQAQIGEIAQQAGEPSDIQDRISYAVIRDVNYENYQVQLILLTGDFSTGFEPDPSRITAFLPLLNSVDDIFLRWGQLRKGLVCRVYWKGKTDIRRGIAEIIGDEEFRFLKKKDRPNEIPTRPYKIFGGGLSI